MTTEEKRDPIIQEAKDATYFLERDKEQYLKSENDFVYVISTNWLKEWRQYTSYDQITQGELPDENWFGKYPPERINQDIIISKDHLIKYPEKDDYRNVIVREDVEENVDYKLIAEDTWKFFANRYDHIAIKRPVHLLPNGEKEVEVALKQVLILYHWRK